MVVYMISTGGRVKWGGLRATLCCLAFMLSGELNVKRITTALGFGLIDDFSNDKSIKITKFPYTFNLSLLSFGGIK